MSVETSVKYIILGAGPTGLGAAHRLRELDEESFLVFERNDYAGGLSTSFTDPKGFTWDIGGHVAFSHYEYYDKLLESLLGDEILTHERESWVRIAGTWVPYPFQNNIRYLPPAERWECLEGLMPGKRPTDKPNNFRQWFETVFGAGICRLFMSPYNFKVWATPPELMAYHWIGERVSIVDLERVARNIALEQDDVAWGPNNTFLFPLKGGTGEIYNRLYKRVADRVRLNDPITMIDVNAKTVTTPSGTYGYEKILSTMPLDMLTNEVIADCPPMVRDAARQLKHNSVHVECVGVDDLAEHEASYGGPQNKDTRCWMYFPEGDSPFYRTTNFHNYSPNNVAIPGQQRGLMTETSSSDHKHEDMANLMDRTIKGLVSSGLMEAEAEKKIVSTFDISVEYGYPVPTLTRDKALAHSQPWLEEQNIFSRGRFGGWRYEVSNMDHSVMQGVEWAQRMVNDTPETTYTVPE